MNAQDLVSQLLSEGRGVGTADFISKLRSHPDVEKIVSTWYMADGSSALVRTKDGNAYEIQVRQAGQGAFPPFQNYTKSPEASRRKSARLKMGQQAWQKPS